MYNDSEDMSNPHDTAPLDTTPSTHSILSLNGKKATEYSDDAHPQRDLTLAGALPATSGWAQPTRVYHRSTHTHTLWS